MQTEAVVGVERAVSRLSEEEDEEAVIADGVCETSEARRQDSWGAHKDMRNRNSI